MEKGKIPKRIFNFGYQETRKITSWVASRQGTIIGAFIVNKVELLFEKALTVTHRDRLLPIDTKDFSNVIAVQLKIRYHSQLKKTLQRHQNNETDGSDPFHKSKSK